MAKEDLREKAKTRKEESVEKTFSCQCCDQDKPLSELRVITRFFPLLVVCRECEEKMR